MSLSKNVVAKYSSTSSALSLATFWHGAEFWRYLCLRSVAYMSLIFSQIDRVNGSNIQLHIQLFMMRQRITFIHEPQDALDPSTLAISQDSLKASEEFKAAREHRITFGFDQLPQELYRALKACHEIHLRWSSPISYPTVSPFVSRVSPGLHIFFTPQPKFKNSYVE